MRKKISIILVIVLIVLNTMSFNSYKTSADGTDRNRVVRFLTSVSEDDPINDQLVDKIRVIANNLSVTDGIEEIFYVATPISIIGIQDYYYLLIGYDNAFKYVAKVGLYNDTIAISYSEDFSAILNQLPDGDYFFVENDGNIYLSRNDGWNYLVEGDCNKETKKKVDLMDFRSAHLTTERFEIVNIYNDTIIVEPINYNRAIAQKTLSVPYHSNLANYCYLCAAVSICEFFGYNVSMSSAHSLIHNDHLYMMCLGGTIFDAINIIGQFAHKAGSITGGLSAAQTMTEISADRPILSRWDHYEYDGNGNMSVATHAMVVNGYIFDTNNMDFTYVIRDSNPASSSYVYLISNYNASNVVYYNAGDSFSWNVSYYNLYDY